MSLLDYSEIPGYLEAVEKEQTGRDLAFLPFGVPLCGITVRQLTARHVILLRNCGNAFFCGRDPGPEDVAMFLWFVSEEYCLDRKKRNEFIAAHLRKLKFAAAVKAIADFIADSFDSAPASAGSSQIKNYTSAVAVLIDVLAREYGWDDEAILEKPIARLHQYIRLILKRNNPGLALGNRSDNFISQWLVKRNGGN